MLLFVRAAKCWNSFEIRFDCETVVDFFTIHHHHYMWQTPSSQCLLVSFSEAPLDSGLSSLIAIAVSNHQCIKAQDPSSFSLEIFKKTKITQEKNYLGTVHQSVTKANSLNFSCQILLSDSMPEGYQVSIWAEQPTPIWNLYGAYKCFWYAFNSLFYFFWCKWRSAHFCQREQHEWSNIVSYTFDTAVHT